ncbi:PREDICTED: uncharacterized protein LOC100636306 [Amphimedon queenslandica]|uniref:Short-chain collagen C4-like n=3 Tax=Amphimedon queenslandica TaxID=400682 RepID=A0AAN0ISX6_AMPQE|nr:PREDICTED: uncharacterized protein LOC100636306 [Amphimedon queenslandica]|eukprot:XP_011408471.1 PREDICTED: uncharacterized protein LOC100636306 [Amphimedon queenslandica]
MYGTEYEVANGIFPGKDNHNAPCAVCYTSTKSVKLMIPARTSCPSSWTMEYKGYLMAEHYNHRNNKVYECVDENPESIDGSEASTDGALFYFTMSTCNGLPCPPYVNNRAITCVVCTKIAKLMIPARIECPDSSWTMEYKGYLMTEKYDHPRNAVYECVDENPESVDGGEGNTDGALFYFTRSTCNGLPCPPYVNNRAITCVVCTK